jgi:hypothetical protein
MNVLNALPQSVQARAKGHRHDIWQAGTRAEAEVAFDFFVETYGVKWDKAVDKLVKDRAALLTFYDDPAEHWKHIRTSNPIESTRHGPPSHETHQGVPEPPDRLGHGLQADDRRTGQMAQARWPEPVGRDHPEG